MKNKEYVLVRTEKSGVHVGFLEKEKGNEATLSNTRRIWYWDGAFTLSQIALEGVKKPENCKFSVTIPEIRLKGVIEIMLVTDKAKENIASVKETKV